VAVGMENGHPVTPIYPKLSESLGEAPDTAVKVPVGPSTTSAHDSGLFRKKPEGPFERLGQVHASPFGTIVERAESMVPWRRPPGNGRLLRKMKRENLLQGTRAGALKQELTMVPLNKRLDKSDGWRDSYL
jgi:hypothetical protein